MDLTNIVDKINIKPNNEAGNIRKQKNKPKPIIIDSDTNEGMFEKYLSIIGDNISRINKTNNKSPQYDDFYNLIKSNIFNLINLILNAYDCEATTNPVYIGLEYTRDNGDKSKYYIFISKKILRAEKSNIDFVRKSKMLTNSRMSIREYLINNLIRDTLRQSYSIFESEQTELYICEEDKDGHKKYLKVENVTFNKSNELFIFSHDITRNEYRNRAIVKNILE